MAYYEKIDDLAEEMEQMEVYEHPSVEFVDGTIRKFDAVGYDSREKILIGKIKRISYYKKFQKVAKIFKGYKKEENIIDAFIVTGFIKKDVIAITDANLRNVYLLNDTIDKTRYKIIE